MAARHPEVRINAKYIGVAYCELACLAEAGEANGASTAVCTKVLFGCLLKSVITLVDLSHM